jgi:sugar lactone lactonase YvrE
MQNWRSPRDIRRISGWMLSMFFLLGVPWAQAQDLYVSSEGTNEVLRYDGTTGAFKEIFVAAGSGGLIGPQGLVFGPDGKLYVSSLETHQVLRYDGATGAFMDVFVAAGSGGLNHPEGLAFGPDNNLYVSSAGTNQVLRYDGMTGAFMDVFVAGDNVFLPAVPLGLVFGPDGALYVASEMTDEVLRYDGATMTGSPMNVFVDGFSGLNSPDDLVFDPDGNLYVTSDLPAQVFRRDGNTGAFNAFVPDAGSMLNGAASGLAFGPDGSLYVSDLLGNQILRYDGTTGAFMDTFVPSPPNPMSGGLTSPTHLVFHRPLLGSGPAEEVQLNIKPVSPLNRINPKSNGLIRVAILSTETFDATTVNPLSVRFGPKGAVEAHNKGHIHDVNHDGARDLVLHFTIQTTGIECGHMSASLTGETFARTPIRGSDAIQTVGCKK